MGKEKNSRNIAHWRVIYILNSLREIRVRTFHSHNKGRLERESGKIERRGYEFMFVSVLIVF